MNDEILRLKIDLGLLNIFTLIPSYMECKEDKKVSNGNVAVCIIDQKGSIYGRMYCSNKVRRRNSFKLAWLKASQVWLTGVQTGFYEKLYFNDVVDDDNGVEAPDLVGWKGGQPITLSDGTSLSIGFSGFRGESDLEIVTEAFKDI
ncbi:heme-binding protein [Flavobacterium luteolum]|uniref:heme-binding protein n=1 Tax=Flavobacterium luteolum TaxID=3003259 RepID=UPI00248DCB0D|nr:heme-binding protein [Flavobacterium luteolum]